MEFLVTLHSLVRWVVLLAGAAAVIKAIIGVVGKQLWTPLDNRLGLIYTISFDIQILLGLLLYIAGPIMRNVWGGDGFGAAMSNADLRFYAVEHIFIMLLSVGAAHMGRSLAKKAATDVKKHQRSAIFFGISLLLMLAGIPWNRL